MRTDFEEVLNMGKGFLKKNRPDYKWVIAAMCILILFAGLGFCSSAKNLYIKPITEAFGFPSSLFTINDSIRYVTVSFVTVFFHKLVQKFGTRKLICAGLICYIIYAVINIFAETIPLFYLGGVFLGIGVALSSTTMISVVINKWFVKNKGTVLGVVLSSNAIGATIAALAAARLMSGEENVFGYRNAYFLTAAVLLVVMVVFLVFYREKPEETSGEENVTEKKKERELTGHEHTEFFKSPWFYVVIGCLFFYAVSGINGAVIPHLEYIGFDKEFVTASFSISTFALAISKLLVGFIYDRFGIKAAVNTCLISSFAAKGLLIIITATELGKVLVISHSLLNALATPLETVMLPILALDLFGEKSFAESLAITSTVLTVGQALNAPLAHLPYDLTGSYSLSFWISTVVAAITLVLINVAVASLKRKEKTLVK